MSTEASPPTAVTRHHVGPLLTVFEPHSLCGKPTILSTTVQLETKSRYAVEYGETMGAWAPRDPNASLPCPVVSEIQCMPSSVSHNAPKAFYSPGLWCPSGWYTAARIVASKTDKLGLDRGIIRSTLLPDETVNICCPRYESPLTVNVRGLNALATIHFRPTPIVRRIRIVSRQATHSVKAMAIGLAGPELGHFRSPRPRTTRPCIIRRRW